MKSLKMVALVLICLGIVAVGLMTIRPQKISKNTDRIPAKTDCALNAVDLFDFTDPDKCDILTTLAIGVEVKFSFNDSCENKTQRFSLNVSSLSTQNILDEVVRRNPGYYWKENHGVINILPSQPDRDFGAVSPLDMTIPSFEAHQTTPYSALEYLRRLGQENNIPITTGFYEIAIKQGGRLPDSSGKLENPEAYHSKQLIDVVIPHEVSIRDCLNAIVLANPPARWRAIKFRDKKIMLALSSSQQEYSRGKNIDMTGSYKLP